MTNKIPDDVIKAMGAAGWEETSPDLLRAIRAALAAAEAKGWKLVGWQSMETAPKDGTRIYGCDEDGNTATIYWHGDRWFEHGAEVNTWYIFPPVLWMLLPAAPSAKP